MTEDREYWRARLAPPPPETWTVACGFRGCTTLVQGEGFRCPPCADIIWGLLDADASTLLPELAPKGEGRARSADMSPEAVAEREQAKVREGQAVAYVNAYRGSWGLVLDLRSDPRWGSKHMRLSARQVEVLLQAKARDEQRAAEAVAAADPEYTALAAWVTERGRTARPGTFFESLAAQIASGRTLSPKQRETAERIRAEGMPTAAPTPGVLTPAEVAEGWYFVDGTPWKVQHNLQHTGLYAKRLDIVDGKGEWTYVSGGLRTVRATGTRMTLEEAAAFGKLYGICGVCGRELTDEKSIAAGIGPICARRLS